MEENYSDWEFMLDGNPHVLRGLSESRGTAYFNVYGGVDHYLDCPNDDFRMSTLYAQDETDAHTVWQVGHELVGLFNGATTLLSMDARKLSIHRLIYKGRAVREESVEESSGLLGAAPFPQRRIDEEFTHVRKQSVLFTLLHLATENKDVYFILKYMNMEAGWVMYYKLMEALEEFAKAKSIDLGTDEKARKSFTNTANNFSLSGFDARHGFKQVVKANKTPTMSLIDAHGFVTAMAKTFLKKAYLNVQVAT